MVLICLPPGACDCFGYDGLLGDGKTVPLDFPTTVEASRALASVRARLARKLTLFGAIHWQRHHILGSAIRAKAATHPAEENLLYVPVGP